MNQTEEIKYALKKNVISRYDLRTSKTTGVPSSYDLMVRKEEKNE